jgi:hypothetical protein
MLNLVHREHEFSHLFVAYRVDRYSRTQTDLERKGDRRM